MAVENITLNLIPTGDTPSIHVAQFDVDRPFNVTLKEGADDFTPTGYDIELQVRKVDNNIVTTVPTQISGNVVTFNTTEQMTACSGTNIAELQLTKDSQTFATLHFYLVVQRDVLAGGVTSESDIYNLTEQIAAIVPEVIGDDYYNKEEIDEKIAEIPTFDPTNYYDKSDVDALLNDKANISDLPDMTNYYDKSDVDALLNDKANISDLPDMTNYYDKSDVDTLLNDKADVSDLPDMNDYYTKSEVDTKITDLYQIKTASGSIVHITDGGNAIPVKSLASEIVAVESGSGEKSPTNPYTISGFANGVITRCGKNLFNFSPTTVTSSRTIASDIFLKAGNYVCSFFIKNTTAISGYFQVRIGTTSIGGVNFAANYQGIVRKAFILSEDSTVNIFVGGASAGYNFEFSNGQIELGTTSTTFEAYNGNTYTFAFGQTVYGGQFDNKGNLVVTHNIVDMGSLNWSYSSQNGWFQVVKPSDAKPVNNMNLLCSCYVNNGTSTSLDLSIFQTANDFRVKDSNYTDADVFKTAVNGQKIVYELANPITLSITSQDIPTLLGENNIFSNTGDVEVNYFTSKSDGIAELIRAFM